MRKIALHWQIFIGMGLGIIVGIIFIQFPFGKDFVLDFIKPFGNMFISALKLIAIPLILASLIKGISDLKDITKLSRIGFSTIAIYLVTTVLAVIIGLLTANIIKPGKMLSESTRNELLENFQGDVGSRIEIAKRQQEAGPLDALEKLIPDNLVSAAADNINMLQIIFCAIFFALALVMIPEDKAAPVKTFFDSLNDVILKIIDLLMITAPIGVFALIAGLVVEVPDTQVLLALATYALCVILGYSLCYLYTQLWYIYLRAKNRVFS